MNTKYSQSCMECRKAYHSDRTPIECNHEIIIENVLVDEKNCSPGCRILFTACYCCELDPNLLCDCSEKE